MDYEFKMAMLSEERQKLFDADGKPLYVQAEHTRRLSELLTQAEQTYQQYDAEQADTIENIKTQIEQLQQDSIATDPIQLLSPAELQRANDIKQFLADDLELPQNKLRIKVEQAIARGDRPTMAVYYHLLTTHQSGPVLQQLLKPHIVETKDNSVKIKQLQSDIGQIAKQRTEARLKFEQFSNGRYQPIAMF